MPIPPTMLSADVALQSMADVVEDLYYEFGDVLAKATVVRVVRRCGRELAIDGSTSTYLLHNRAHSRLQDHAASERPTTSSGSDRGDRPPSDYGNEQGS